MEEPHSNSVKIVEVCRVAPQPCSPDSPLPSQYSLPLTFFDITWLRMKPVQRVFFYETSSTDTIIPRLKTSLSLTLQHFLPLVGKLTWPLESHKPILSYVQGDAVSLTIAESEAEADFHRLASSEYLEASKFHPLVPELAVTSEQAEVLVVQITVFGNLGFSIGTSMHHAMVDGKSTTMFFKSWAHICKHGPVSLPGELKPCYSDRHAIKDPKGMETMYCNDWLSSGGPNNRSLMIPETKVAPVAIRGTFEFTEENIEKLRRHVKIAMDSDSNHHLSSFALTCGYTWACLVKAEEETINTDQVWIVFSVECRSRLDPPVSATYFGNCIVGHLAVAETTALLGGDGFVVAVHAISKTIKALEVSDGLLKGAETLVKSFGSAKGTNRVYSVAGSRIFKIYDTDFGWGRPKRTEVVSIDRTGAISFSDSRNGGRGIDVGVVLKEAHMKVFASLFVKGLAGLD